MPDTIDIRIQSTFSGGGVQQATAAYKQLQAAQDQLKNAQAGTAAAGQRTTAETEKAAAAVAKAEKAVLSEASAIAKLQQAQGNATQGAQTLATALAQVDQSSMAATRAQTQLAQAENRIAAEAQRAATAQRTSAVAGAQMATAANTSGLSQVPGQLNSIVGGAQKVALAFGAIGAATVALRGITDLAQLGARASEARDSFTNLATAAGSSSAKLLTAMHAAAAGTVSDTQLMISANTGLLLAGDKIATALPRLLEIARAAAKATGQDVGFLYDSLVRGIARGSPRIIDNAGITLDAAAAMDTYARSIGKTSDQLTSSEQQQATLNAVLTTGATFIEKIGLAADTDAVKMQQASAAVDDFKAALGERLLPVIGTVAQGLGNLLKGGDMFAGAKGGADQAQATIAAQATSYEDYVARINAANDQLHEGLAKTDPLFAALAGGLNALTPAQLAYAQSLIATGTAQGEAVAQAQALQGVADNLQRTFFNVGAGAELSASQQAALGAQMLTVAASGEQGVAAVDALTFAFQNHEINAAQLAAGLTALTTEQENHAAAAADDASMMAQVTPAVQQATTAVEDHAQALISQAAQSAIARAEGDLLTQTQDNLYSAAMAAVAGSNSLAGAATILAAQFNLPIAKARELIGLLAQIGQQAHVKMVTENRDDLRNYRTNAAAPQPLSASFLADQKKRTDDLRQAQIGLANAQGQTAKSTALLRQEQAGYTKGSAEWLKVEAQIVSANKARGGGGRAGAAGGAPRETAAQKTGDQLATIERDTGRKLADIDANTQQKLIAIDEKAAAQRAAAQRSLAAEIMTSTDDLIASQEADDLDLIGAKDDQAKKLAARESAQAKARIANEKAVNEAKATAAGGDAQQAQDVLKVRQEAIKQQEALDQHYAERQAELAGNPQALAALKVQYDEATAAIAQSESDRVSLTQQAADQRAQAIADEKIKVIGDAEEQKQKVIAAAQEQLEKVKGASADQRASVVGDLQAQAAAASAWAQQTEVSAGRVVAAYAEAARAAAGVPGPGGGGGGGGGGAGVRAAGGGSFVTHGPTSFTVGDNPGGMELVSVVPLSGRGTTIMSGGNVRMAGGGSALTMAAGLPPRTGIGDADAILDILINGTKNQKAQISALKQYLAIVQQAAEIINTIAQIRATLATPQPLLRVEDMQHIADDAALVTTILADSIVPATRLQANQLKGYTEMIKISVEALKSVTDLRKGMTEAKTPLSEATIRQLATEVQMVTRILIEMLLPSGRQQKDALEFYADLTGKAVAILKDIADLRSSLKDLQGPLDERIIRQLAAEAQRVAGIVRSSLLPTSEVLATEIGQYAETVGRAVGILKDTMDLRGAGKDLASPISEAALRNLAGDAQRIAYILRQSLLPTSEEEAKAMSEYADVVDHTIGILKNVMDLRTAGKEIASPLSEADIRALASEALRIVRVLRQTLLPTTAAQGQAISAYADAAEQSLGVLKAVLDLGGKLFTDYTPPTDAQINRVARDAERITRVIARAAATFDTKGLEAAKLFNEAAGGTFATIKDGLLAIEALNSGDFEIKPGSLERFERSTIRALETARRLGALAATIPASQLNALDRAMAAISATAEALIKAAAAPNLPPGLFGSPMGGPGPIPRNAPQAAAASPIRLTTGPTIINVYPPPGAGERAIADNIIQRVERRTGMRRVART